MIYLDNAATTALSETAGKAMEPYFSDLYGNPSSSYRFGQEAKRAIEAGRQALASFLHVSPREIYFTGGGTESDNWALLSLLGWGEKSPKHLLTSTIEHPAILRTASFLESLGVKVSRIPVDAKGFLNLEALENALKQSENTTCLVSVMAANNEIGTLQNLQEIGSLAHRYSALFHTDAVQAFGQIPIAVEEMGIDLLSASSHKIHGPKGVGLLYIRKDLKLPALLHGGAQERGLRAGTENVPGIVGFAAAAREAFSTMEERGRKKLALRNLFFKRLLEEVPGVEISGVNPLEKREADFPAENTYSSLLQERLPGNVHVCIPGIEGQSLLMLLDQKGICASSGSACASGSLDPSHVLLAIGKSHEAAFSGLRLSLEESLTEEELEYTVEAIKEAVEKSR